MTSNDALHSDRIQLRAAEENYHIIYPTTVTPEILFGRMFGVEVTSREFLEVGKSCESGLAQSKLWIPDDDELVKLCPPKAELGTQAWAETVVVPLFLS